MARRRLKLTGFARFFIVMLFLVPVAYLAASYYNGQDGIENIKKMLGIRNHKKEVQTQRRTEDRTVTTIQDAPATNTAPRSSSSLDSLRRDLNQLEERMNKVELENARLRELVRQQQERISALKR